MLIYIVRWPDLSASFVSVESEEHLLDILNQVGNGDDCNGTFTRARCLSTSGSLWNGACKMTAAGRQSQRSMWSSEMWAGS